MKKGQIPIILLGGIVIIVAVLWFTGTYDKLFSRGGENRLSNILALDLEQLQITIRTVSSPVIEELEFIEAIDTLSANESIAKLRNPFVKVYVAPPRSEKPKAKTTSKKKKIVKRKKRVIRPKVALTGIIWDLSNPYAILNNDIYAEGDFIKGYTVQSIQDTMVVLVNNDDIFSIILVRE